MAYRKIENLPENVSMIFQENLQHREFSRWITSILQGDSSRSFFWFFKRISKQENFPGGITSFCKKSLPKKFSKRIFQEELPQCFREPQLSQDENLRWFRSLIPIRKENTSSFSKKYCAKLYQKIDRDEIQDKASLTTQAQDYMTRAIQLT